MRTKIGDICCENNATHIGEAVKKKESSNITEPHPQKGLKCKKSFNLFGE